MRNSSGKHALLFAALCLAFTVSAYAQTSVLYWCESSDTNRLNLAVTKVGNKYYLNDISGFTNTSKVKNYYLDWDLLGTPSQPKAVTNIEVEPGQLHLVNLDMINQGRTINEYWDSNAGRERVVAWVWVGGSPQPQTNISPQISEIRESGSWFYFEKGKRLPAFSQRFPTFTLPSNKFLHIQKYATRDTTAGYESHGVDKSGICLSVNFFRDPLGDDTNGANEALHISPTEAGFLGCSWSFLTGMAGVGQQYDHIIMDQEWWHNDYQTGTLARMCFFMNECKRLNPAVRISDWWAGKPYDRGIFRPVEGNRPVIDPMWVAQDYNPTVATANGDATFLTPVNANGVTTTLAEAENAVSINAYPNAIFSHDYIANRPDIGNYDFEIYNVIHHTRVNKRMSVNTGKPHVWFCSLLQFSAMNEPLVPYSTRTTSPPGTFTFAEDLMVAPSACEAWGFFSMFEGDGAYLWDDGAFYDGEDPNGIFKKAIYSINFNDNRGIWTPDVPGTPIATTGVATNGYPSYHTYQPDYLALGVWKYTAIADIVTNGTKVDFQYSTNNGATWYIPPTNGSTMCEVASNLGVIVVGAVSSNQIAIAAFNPFQSVTSTTHVIARYGGNEYGFDLQGKRVRVFRGGLLAPILIPPVITHTPVSIKETVPPFVITAGATDDVQIASAVLWWNKNGGTWASTAMSNAAGVLTGTIAPTNATHLDQFQYHIVVSDDQGLTVTNGVHNFIYSLAPASAFVHAGTSWRYLATNTAPLATWKNVGFDDSPWPTGTTPMGYGGDVDLVTPLSYGPQSTNKYPATYFRTTFTATNVTALLALSVYARVDDGMVIHLNGTEVQRINMPGGAISHTNYAAGNASNAPRPWQVYAINPALVVNGQNTLAVEVHQASASSSDLYFDLQLQPSQIFNWPIPVTPNKLFSIQTNAPAWTVSAQTTNSNQVASMLLRWNRNGGSWSNVPMSGTGGVFSASLAPGAFEDEDQFGYEIQTTSLLGVATTNGPFGTMYLIPKGADLFPAESSWKYLVTNSDPASTWKTNGFNDATWPSGSAPFGYGGVSDDKATLLGYGPDAANKYITTYFRKTFTTTNPGSITALRSYMRVDDGLVVYINGHEAVRDTMPGGTVTHSTLAYSGAVDAPRVWEIDNINPLMLVTGLNTIAVELHQVTPGSSDTFFDLFLQPESGTTITHTPLDTIQTTAAPWTVSSLVNSYLPLTSVTLFWGQNFGSMSAYPMTSSVPGTYAAMINPVGLADRDQFQYRIEAVDTLNTTSSYGSVGFIYVAQEAAALIPAGASDWKYLAQPNAPDASWSAPTYDDSAWSQGAAPLGIGGEEKLNTIVDYGPDPNNKYTTYYFRKTFTLGQASAVADMRTFFRMDDGLVVYLNGQPWNRINMPTGGITHSTFAAANAANPPRPWYYMSMNEEMLVNGTNTIAVEIHQANLTSSDLSFDMHMYPEYRPALTHTVLPSFITSQPPWSVTTTIESFYPLTSVKLWWTKVGGSWTNVDMSGTGGVYSAMIAPGSVADHDHFQYHIDAVDNQGQTIVNGTWGFMYVAPPALPLVSPGSGWKYLATNSGPTSSWNTVNYIDTSWGVGVAAFGFGGNEVYGTVLGYGPDNANKYPTYYFRRTFTLTGTVALATLKSYFQADDGIVVYINGQEAGRTNMPAGPISYTNYALGSSPNEPRPWQTLSFNPALVATGINTIAVELHQSSPGSTDLFLDFLLYGSTVVSLDQDSDGMPDAWEQIYFGGSTNGTANADADGDQVSNLGEYITGTDPNLSTSKPTIRIAPVTNSSPMLGIQTTSNRLYAFEYSTSITQPVWTVLTNITGDGTYRTLSGGTNTWKKGLYYRYRARLP